MSSHRSGGKGNWGKRNLTPPVQNTDDHDLSTINEEEDLDDSLELELPEFFLTTPKLQLPHEMFSSVQPVIQVNVFNFGSIRNYSGLQSCFLINSFLF